MKFAPLALALFMLSPPLSAGPFAAIGGDVICTGNLTDISDLDCTYVADDAGWSPELAWCPEPAPVVGRLVAVEWMTATVATTDLGGPGADHDDHAIGNLGEAFVMKVAQMACDEEGIVYFTTVDSELWRFNPDECCIPEFVSPVELESGEPINTIGGDISFDIGGLLWMLGDEDGSGSNLYLHDEDTGAWQVWIENATDGVQGWGLFMDRSGGPIAILNDDHVVGLKVDSPPVDYGLLGHHFEEYGGAANDPQFACSLEVSIGAKIDVDGIAQGAKIDVDGEPESGAKIEGDGILPVEPLVAQVYVRHVGTETVQTTVRAWIQDSKGARHGILNEQVELAYLGELDRRIELPPLEPGSYTLVATISRMNQGSVNQETRFEVR